MFNSSGFLRLCLFAYSGNCLLVNGQELMRDLTITSYDFARKAVPRWAGDALVSIEDTGVAHFFTSDGREVRTVVLTIPYAATLKVLDGAHHADGTAALCGYAIDRVGHFGHFIAVASPIGEPTLIRTDPYAPESVRFATDGTIWAQGFELPPKGGGVMNNDAGVIRRFDRTGREIARYIPQVNLSKNELMLGINNVAVSSNRFGWYQGRSQRYFEISAAGRVEEYAGVSQCGGSISHVIGLALTDNGQTFITRDCLVNGSHKREAFQLDHESRSWKQVTFPGGALSDTTNTILGAFGNSVVRIGRDTGHYILSSMN